MDPSLLTSVTSRALALRWRADLEVHEQRYQGRGCWVVKDPLRLKYFRFEEEELWLLQQLDGRLALDGLQRRFERKFSPQQISPGELQRLLGQAHRSGLLLADGPGQGEVLLARRQTERRRQLWAMLSELMSLRLRGFDPDEWLSKLNHYVGGLFTWPAMVMCVTLTVFACLTVATHWTEFCLRLPSSQEFFGPTNWLALAATLAGVKILHEFGHGLACKRFGGECHEMGVLLLCFTPCLYCDVTDSWRIPSKWRRAAVGAAGMYIELWLAGLATLVWWHTEPGLVHHLALNVMFIGSVSTLLFNANPLMRYDGYYILADLVEVPNLRSKADALLSRTAARWLWGKNSRTSSFAPQRHAWLLASFAIAAAIYRWFMVAAILWFFYQLTEPYGFKIVGQMLALIAVVRLIARPLFTLSKFVQHTWKWERNAMNTSRAIGRLSLLGVAAIALLCLPLPYYIRCAMRLAPHDAATVYIDVAGQLEEILARPGDVVAQGQAIIKLRNLDLELAAAGLETQLAAQEAKVTVLRQRSISDESARQAVAQAEQSLAAIKEELVGRQAQLGKLVICAPRAGVVVPVPRRPPGDAKEQLPSWHGHLLEARNRGATVVASDAVCLIGDPSQWEAVLAIDGRDVVFVQPGQRVDLLPAQRPGNRITASIASVAQRDMQVLPAAMSSRSGGELLTTTDPQGRERPTFVTYEAAAQFEDASALLAHGGGGIARIHAGYQTPAVRLWRELRRTFHFEL